MDEVRMTRAMTKKANELHKLVCKSHVDFTEIINKLGPLELSYIKELEFTDQSLDVHTILYEITRNFLEITKLKLPEYSITTFISFEEFGKSNPTVTHVYMGNKFVYSKAYQLFLEQHPL